MKSHSSVLNGKSIRFTNDFNLILSGSYTNGLFTLSDFQLIYYLLAARNADSNVVHLGLNG